MNGLEVLARYLMWNGEIRWVIAFHDRPSVTLAKPNEQPCPHCGALDRVNVVVDSPLFRDSARPVPTLPVSEETQK